MCTHEQYIHAVKKVAVARLSPDKRDRLNNVKLVYGLGQSGLRGMTWFNKWANGQAQYDLAEVCAFGEDSDTQLAGTTLHELAHVLAGPAAGHGPEWKKACKLLGLRKCSAAGQIYMGACFTPDIRMALANMPKPSDGKPHTHTGNNLQAGKIKIKPCAVGIGTRGGKSRGAGSGSRLRKYVCECMPPVIIRASRDDLCCTCNLCNQSFKRA